MSQQPNHAAFPAAPIGTAVSGVSVSGGITRVNSTGDARIIWEDGHVAIIYAKDFPAGTGMGRSKTRDDVKDAIQATVDDQLQTLPGPGSANKFIKVWLKDLLARPVATQQAVVRPRLAISPADFKPVTPKIAQSGKFKGQVIPDFPHDCPHCGGKFYQGMFSAVHDTPDGLCPAVTGAKPPRRR
jgi:hypothetical protein